jgi:hypothetical protein
VRVFLSSGLKFSGTSIYDEVYGYIDTTELELQIIDTPLFQRLNHLKQLGMTYRVFPGAHHTRFSHSLGVMYIIDKMSQNLGLCSEDQEKMRIVALLHDIGHYPFSHTIEVVLTNHNKNENATHEKFGTHIINNSTIKDILKENYSDEDILKISSIIEGSSSSPLNNQMMSSELDADRLDYLIRDAMHTGVAYGRIDLDRILHTLALDEEGYLSIKEEGKHAAEGYIIGRYLMWATVYTHKTIAGFDEIIQHLYPLIVSSEYTSIEELEKLSEEELTKFDDAYVLSKIHENCRNEKNEYVSDLCKRFVRRDHLELVDEAKMLSADKEAQQKYYRLDAYQYPVQLKALSEISGVDENWIFHNNSSTQFPSLKPIIEKTISGEEAEGKEMQKLLRIKKDDKTIPLVNDNSSIVYNLKDLSFDVVRIFSKNKEFKSKLLSGIGKQWEK